MTTLKRDEILKADDYVVELVDVNKWWGGDVYVKGTTAADFAKLQNRIVGADGKVRNLEDVQLLLASMTICDEQGELLFTEKDIVELGKKSSAPIQKIFKVAQRLSGLGDDEIEHLKDGLQENPTGDLPSD